MKIIKHVCDIANCDIEAKEFVQGDISVINVEYAKKSIITVKLDICYGCLKEIIGKHRMPVREKSRIDQREEFNYLII